MSKNDQPRVHIFWDDSNIFLEGRRYAEKNEGAAYAPGFRIHGRNLFSLAAAERELGTGICVGSIPPDLRDFWARLAKSGVAVELFERGKQSGKEQGVDQCLQVHMLRAALDVDKPEVAVLLTGDGAGYEDGVGFHADLERLQKRGWGIEVLSWTHSCKKVLREWADYVGVFIPLESYYGSISFIEDGLRLAQPLDLKKRTKALPIPVKRVK